MFERLNPQGETGPLLLKDLNIVTQGKVPLQVVA